MFKNMLILLMVGFMSTVASAATIVNGNFESASTFDAADWVETAAASWQLYFISGEGPYVTTPPHGGGNTASIMSIAGNAIYQLIDTQASYNFTYSLGYRNDFFATDDISFRVQIYNVTADTVLDEKTYTISAPAVVAVGGGQSGSGSWTRYTETFTVDTGTVGTDQLAVRFINMSTESNNQPWKATALVDNVELEAPPLVIDGAPELSSGWASRRTATSAKLWAQIIDDHNEPCAYWFCYWPNKKDAVVKDSLTTWPGRTGRNVATTVKGLDPNTLYFFQAKASNSEGVGMAQNYGAFWTKEGTPIDWMGPLPLAPPEVDGPVVSAVNVGGGDLTAAGLNFRSDMAHMGTPHKALSNIDQLLKQRFKFNASDVPSSGDASFDAVLQTCRLAEWVRASRTLWLYNLIPGVKYRIQLYSFDPRAGHASEGAAYYYEGELGHGSETFTRGGITSMIGEFTANCRTRAIFWNHVVDTANDPVMNAIVLSLAPGPIFNGDFELATDFDADFWVETAAANQLYFIPGEGPYVDTPPHGGGNTASIASTAGNALYQLIATQASYHFSYSLGYRNDFFATEDISDFRVQIYNVTTDTVLDEKIYAIAAPAIVPVGGGESGSGSWTRYSETFTVDTDAVGEDQLALRFLNMHTASGSPWRATALVDNVQSDVE